MADQLKEQKLNIELPEDVAEGVYSNLAIITHSHSEFIIDFVNVMPGIPKAKVKNRIILTPQHAKRLMKALMENVNKFERTFGEIKEHEQAHIMPPYNIGGPVGEA
jgi:hypothetical protein